MTIIRTAALTCLSIFFCTSLFSQEAVSERKIRYGFLLGGTYSNVVYNALPTNGQIINHAGTRIGIISDIPLNQTFSLAPKAEVAFNGGKVRLDQGPNSELTQEVLPVSADISAHVKVQKFNDRFSPYFFVGPSFRFAINENTDETNVFPSRNDLALDLGIGLNKALSKFDLAPALRYSYGIFNVNQNPALGAIRLHSLSLTLSFLG